MPTLRQLHRYLGVFFTPAIVFFALSGALQAFDLHKGAHRGDPPTYPWIAAMAALHKDQEMYEPPKPKAPVAAPAPAAAAKAAAPEEHVNMPLKLFVVALAVGLCLSSLAGLYIAFTNPRSRRSAGFALAGGMALPALLVLLA
ncbi:hypothetical protein GTP81_16875 [Rugamonas sp. FT107W]|uniref:PepSY domain-containing protein n=1 Tax=Duganella vulcania TaxID=2692166 RepID=A0A845HPS0_9BURK|nr:hypothetical protein [Duganella vulcania]MYN18426.1 hypothetical protein [Duganella vulcania]